MALETATYIGDLVVTNPPASDPLAQASNHLCLIKSVLKNTFPKIDAVVNATAENLTNGTPVGLIAMWSGTTLPAGWTLCNGVAVARMDGTGNITPPDLRDRFIVGSGLSYSLGATGGVALQTVVPPHTHNVADNGHVHGVVDSGHAHGVVDSGHIHGAAAGNFWATAPGGSPVNFGGSGTTMYQESATSRVTTGIGIAAGTTGIGISAGTTGIAIAGTGVNIATGATENRPPFFALAYIMKV